MTDVQLDFYRSIEHRTTITWQMLRVWVGGCIVIVTIFECWVEIRPTKNGRYIVFTTNNSRKQWTTKKNCEICEIEIQDWRRGSNGVRRPRKNQVIWTHYPYDRITFKFAKCITNLSIKSMYSIIYTKKHTQTTQVQWNLSCSRKQLGDKAMEDWFVMASK